MFFMTAPSVFESIIALSDNFRTVLIKTSGDMFRKKPIVMKHKMLTFDFALFIIDICFRKKRGKWDECKRLYGL